MLRRWLSPPPQRTTYRLARASYRKFRITLTKSVALARSRDALQIAPAKSKRQLRCPEALKWEFRFSVNARRTYHLRFDYTVFRHLCL
jgi:hypothetical protein